MGQVSPARHGHPNHCCPIRVPDHMQVEALRAAVQAKEDALAAAEAAHKEEAARLAAQLAQAQAQIQVRCRAW